MSVIKHALYFEHSFLLYLMTIAILFSLKIECFFLYFYICLLVLTKVHFAVDKGVLQITNVCIVNTWNQAFPIFVLSKYYTVFCHREHVEEFALYWDIKHHIRTLCDCCFPINMMESLWNNYVCKRINL